ncbi:hypothetical protein Strvi_0145 (plasmid) [Streptomyces violaceusniger Tu 4113]|uniref:Uncharacterized protein n=1 Tax=Streptomyces violaceusniger (strain Tu 4113) TaxID=653045 RepID=G2PHW9_STRV4|nr:hypothetical protein Strvi_0145 [Streptomyces violaceusniger Tu 4113]
MGMCSAQPSTGAGHPISRRGGPRSRRIGPACPSGRTDACSKSPDQQIGSAHTTITDTKDPMTHHSHQEPTDADERRDDEEPHR